MLNDWITPPYWNLYSKKIRDRLQKPRFARFISSKKKSISGMRFVRVEVAHLEKGMHLQLYWWVDESDGVIAEAYFQAAGPTSLLAAAEIASEWVLRKHYQQASRLTADILDRFARDRRDVPAFPKESFSSLNAVLSLIDVAVQQCLDLPSDRIPLTTPIDSEDPEGEGCLEDWPLFSLERKIELIEQTIEKEIRPYIELDAGGIQLKELKGSEVRIAYEGACTTCYSSIGSTLGAIQKILRSRLHPSLEVVPEFESLNEELRASLDLETE